MAQNEKNGCLAALGGVILEFLYACLQSVFAIIAFPFVLIGNILALIFGSSNDK